jgi:hypothetical protein
MSHQDSDSILTAEDGFAAMYEFLKSYWIEFKTANLVDVLGDLQPAEYGKSSDPAMWDEWMKAVRKVKTRQ